MKKSNFVLFVVFISFFASCSKEEGEAAKIQSKFLGAFKTTRAIAFVDKAGVQSQALLSKTKVKIDPWTTDDSVSVWIGLNSTFRAKVGDSLLINVKDRNIYKPNMVDSLSPASLIKANIVGYGVLNPDGKTIRLNYKISYFVTTTTTTSSTTASETFTINEECSKVEQ